MNCENILNGIKNEYKRWICPSKSKSGGGVFVYNRSIKDIYDIMDKPKLNYDQWLDIVSLNSIAKWYATSGAVDVIDGNVDGWKKIYLSNSMRYQSICYGLYLYDKCIKSNKSNIDECSTIAKDIGCAITMGLIERSRNLWERSIQSLDDGAFGSWELSPLPPFMVKLYSLWHGIDLDLTGRTVRGLPIAPMEGYGSVFRYWNDTKSLGLVLRDLCDFHLTRIEDPNDDQCPEFASYPFGLFPVEIISVLRIRKWMGLEVPEVDHPLMKTPLCNPPETPPVVEDELLTRIKERARKECPGINM